MLVNLLKINPGAHHIPAIPLANTAPEALPFLGASPSTVTVSGMSSGGFMTNQIQVIYSDLFKGAGIVAGGPFDCAQDKLLVGANTNCIHQPGLVTNSWYFNNA